MIAMCDLSPKDRVTELEAELVELLESDISL